MDDHSNATGISGCARRKSSAYLTSLLPHTIQLVENGHLFRDAHIAIHQPFSSGGQGFGTPRTSANILPSRSTQRSLSASNRLNTFSASGSGRSAQGLIARIGCRLSSRSFHKSVPGSNKTALTYRFRGPEAPCQNPFLAWVLCALPPWTFTISSPKTVSVIAELIQVLAE